MAFQPFGYVFDIGAPMRRTEVKTAIRSRLKRWFDPSDGARGWIVGPFICLWSSMLSRYGPMVFARIQDDGFATRIRGRAGSDLNGSLWMVILCVFLLVVIILAGTESFGEMILPAGIMAVALPVVLWMGHSDRHEADHLVRFLEDVVTPGGKSRRVAAARVEIPASFSMDVNGEKMPPPLTGTELYDALRGTSESDYVIVSAEEEVYIQTLSKRDGMMIEKREGSADRHYRAVRTDTVGECFSLEETWTVFTAYVSGKVMPDFLRWELVTV